MAPARATGRTSPGRRRDPTPASWIEVGGLSVGVVRKRMRTLRLRVVAPRGEVRVSVPWHTPMAAVRQFVAEHLSWIEGQRQRLARMPPPKRSSLVDGEVHLVQGEECRLEVHDASGREHVSWLPPGRLLLHVSPQASTAEREHLLRAWYAERMRERVPELLQRWQPALGVELASWTRRWMTSRWGSCNPQRRRICLNLELMRRRPECLEYVVVHELVHLRERGHGPRFVALMDQYLPDWRRWRSELNARPIEPWGMG